MACISYNNLWAGEFDNIVSEEDEVQDINTNQWKLEVHDTYKKDEKITTNFEPTDDSDVTYKRFSDKNLSKIESQISCFGKDYNEFKSQNNRHSMEENLIQIAVKTTIQLLYDNGLFDNFPNADNVSKDFRL